MRRFAALLTLGLLTTGTAGATTIARVTLLQMEGSASVVFVGVFESAHRAPLGERPGVRYRIRVERFLRGGPADTVHLWTLDIPGIALGVEQGQRYLVFAERRRFGRTRQARLTASGYHQGVYRVLDDTRASNVSNGEVDLRRLPAELRRQARVRVTLVHEVNRSRSAYIEGAAYVIRLERGGAVVAKEAGYFEDPARFRVRQGWYVIASGAHPCGGPGCGSLDFQNDLGIDTCRKPIRLTGMTTTIRVVAEAGKRCQISAS
jgi:hypothetical protein